jgi:hypothetical protein
MRMEKRSKLLRKSVKVFKMRDLQLEIMPDSIREVLKVLLKNPLVIIWRWNWKSAVLSGLLRGPIFFMAYKKEGYAVAIGAMFAQTFSRMLFGGVNGAIIQSFSRVEPEWHAFLTVPLVLAAFSHLIEFIVQSAYDNYYGSASMGKAITVSIAISILSAIFNLFAMHRGSFLVKDERQQSLLKDFGNVPRLVFGFIAYSPRKVFELIVAKNYLSGVFTAVLTSVFIGILTGMIRGKVYWGTIATGITFFLITVSVISMFILNTRKLRQLESD